jgi:RNA polymerase sigma-70 factor (ECF subfamily)
LHVDLLTLPARVPLLPVHALLRGIFGLILAPQSTSSRPAATAWPGTAALAADADVRRQRDAELAGLLQAAAGGDAQAFERLYDQTIGYVHALLRRMLPQADIDDVAADLYFQAWRDAAGFDVQRGSAVTWLLTIARSRALDLLRHRKASPEVAAGGEQAAIDAAPLDAPGPLDLLAGLQARARLHDALSRLSAQERWVLGLAYYRELSHREVSVATGLPLGSVKSLILRAQAKLRALLAESMVDSR